MDAVDLLLLIFTGVVIASVPLAIAWIARPRTTGADRLRRLAWITVFLTFDLIVFGAFTRLTDSGLGCPDWPGCYAQANPFRAAPDIRAAETAMPGGPVTMTKAWIEMIHRFLAMAIGLLIVSMLLVSLLRARGARVRGRGTPTFPALAAGLLAVVLLQGAFGAWTVTQKLQPIFVTMHLLFGLLLFALLITHAMRFDAPRAATGSPSLRGLALFAAAVAVVQIALGGWVSANYAVLACSDFPTCRGVWVPPMDLQNAFHLWRDLGRAADGGDLSPEALIAIHWVHRCGALVVFAVLGTLAWRAQAHEHLRRPGQALAALLVAQGATGVVNVVFAWPLLAAVLHNAGAAGIVACLVVINSRLGALASQARPAVKAHRPPLVVAAVSTRPGIDLES